MANRYNCERCGLEPRDLPEIVDPDMLFERSKVTGEILCQACLCEIDFEPGWVDLEP